MFLHTLPPRLQRERETDSISDTKEETCTFPHQTLDLSQSILTVLLETGKKSSEADGLPKTRPRRPVIAVCLVSVFSSSFLSFEWCSVVSPPSRKPSLSFILFLVLSPPYSFLCCLAAICRRRGHWRTPTGCGPRHNVGFVCVSSINSGRRRCLFSRLHG